MGLPDKAHTDINQVKGHTTVVHHLQCLLYFEVSVSLESPAFMAINKIEKDYAAARLSVYRSLFYV
jgi:hypothetical protein